MTACSGALGRDKAGLGAVWVEAIGLDVKKLGAGESARSAVDRMVVPVWAVDVVVAGDVVV